MNKITLKLTEKEARELKQFVDAPAVDDMVDEWIAFLDTISSKLKVALGDS